VTSNQVQAKRNECIQLVNKSNRKINEIRISKSESQEHIKKKMEICESLEKQNKHFITEAIFSTGGRADILVLDDFKVIEIVCSEKEESLIRKKSKYPPGLKIEIVKVK